jgi:hypothetical protein
VNINGPITNSGAGTEVAWLSTKVITFAIGSTSDGYFYASNAGGSGQIKFNQATTLTGAAASDKITVGNTTTVIHDPSLDYAMGNSLYLPGYGY